MRRIGKNTFTEIYFAGCNPGFLETSDGVVMFDSPQMPIDAMRWKERMNEAGPIRYLINTESHGDHIQGNCFFPEAEVIGQKILQEGFHDFLARTPLEGRIEKAKTQDPDSVWLLDHPSFPPHGPTRSFDDSLTLHCGNHTIECIHMPGHTAAQTSIFLPDEGVVFTGDNVFCECKSFLQEADPWLWLEALDRIEALDVEVIVPGHGEPCTKAYLHKQGEIIHNWLGFVERCIERGMTEDEALACPVDIRKSIDPYPIGQRLFASDDRVTQINLRNLYRRIIARQSGNATP